MFSVPRFTSVIPAIARNSNIYKFKLVSDSDSIVLLWQGTFILLRHRVSHLHDAFHYFVFRSILLPDISLSRSPHHRHPPPILLLRQLLFPSHQAHPISSSIFSSPCHSIYTLKKYMYRCFFSPHTQRSSSYFHSIPLNHLTGRQPPLTINLTLAPTLSFTYFSLFG